MQHEWHLTAEGRIEDERPVIRVSGRRERIDVHATSGSEVAVVEIKASDWDRMTPHAVRRNARRQVRQIWSYVEAELKDAAGVSPGIIFSTTPKNPTRKAMIENIFAGELIAVVWYDE